MGKGRKERVTLLGGPAREALDAYLTRAARSSDRLLWLHRWCADRGSGRDLPQLARRRDRRSRRALPARSADARRRTAQRRRRHTRCATRSPATCSRAAPICASSRSCSATRAWARRRSTRTSRLPRLRSAYRRRIRAHRETAGSTRSVSGAHPGARRPDRRGCLPRFAHPGLRPRRRHHQRIRRGHRARRLFRGVPRAGRDLPARRCRRAELGDDPGPRRAVQPRRGGSRVARRLDRAQRDAARALSALAVDRGDLRAADRADHHAGLRRGRHRADRAPDPDHAAVADPAGAGAPSRRACSTRAAVSARPPWRRRSTTSRSSCGASSSARSSASRRSPSASSSDPCFISRADPCR